MADLVKKARESLRRVMSEFEPVKDHAVGAGKELLLAIRSAVDAELKLLDAAAGKKCEECGSEPAAGATPPGVGGGPSGAPPEPTAKP
jgi:hypothetical protein